MRPIVVIAALLIPLFMNAQELPFVDIERFQGPWYVIGYKPTFMDGNWINTIESYDWDADRKRYDVLTTYRKKPGGKLKSIKQKLLPVENSNNARWIARIWFFIRADYVIYKIADDYSWVVVGHPKQKYLYIMSRTPQMDEQLYDELLRFSLTLGYHEKDIRKQPQESAKP